MSDSEKQSEGRYRVLSKEDLHSKTKSLSIFDQDGNAVPVTQIFDRNSASQQRNVIVFIRHFYCGSCEEYVRALSRKFTDAALSQCNPATTISIIGCGDHSQIDAYRRRTNCKYDIYADPQRKLYRAFDLLTSLNMGAKPVYETKSMTGIIVSSIWNGLMAGPKVLSGGNVTQLGGEFIFVDGNMVFAHRMSTTRDHLEIDDLEKALRDTDVNGRPESTGSSDA